MTWMWPQLQKSIIFEFRKIDLETSVHTTTASQPLTAFVTFMIVMISVIDLFEWWRWLLYLIWTVNKIFGASSWSKRQVKKFELHRTHSHRALEFRVSRTSTWLSRRSTILLGGLRRIIHNNSAFCEHYSKINCSIKRVHYQMKEARWY